jgi:hypothetical protein
LKFLPGIGRDRARTLVIKRPKAVEELLPVVGLDVLKTLALIKMKLGGKWL